MFKRRAEHLQRLLHIPVTGVWDEASQYALDEFARYYGFKVHRPEYVSRAVYSALLKSYRTARRSISNERKIAKKNYRRSIITELPNSLDTQEMVKFYGYHDDIEAILVKVEPAYPLYYQGSEVTSVRFHPKVADNLDKVFQDTARYFTEDRIRVMGLDQYSGTYSNRPVRGGKRKSTHAYGCAIDMFALLNRLAMRKPEALFSQPEYVDWLDIWLENGFVSLGLALNYDWMHFQMAHIY